MLTVKLFNKEFDFKGVVGKATVITEIESDLISDIVPEFSEQPPVTDGLPVVVLHEAQYIFITGTPSGFIERGRKIKVRLCTKYALKKAELNDADLVAEAEKQHQKNQIKKPFTRHQSIR